MIELQNLLQENEIIITYHITTDGWFSRNAITRKGNSDVAGALEETLHRILEAGGAEEDVKRIMGAEIPTDEEISDLEEYNNYVNIDLGYILPGLIDAWEEKEDNIYD